jgi:hypothetical protein
VLFSIIEDCGRPTSIAQRVLEILAPSCFPFFLFALQVAMVTALASGRATKEDVQEIQNHMYCWSLEKTGSFSTAQKIVNCLDESFLLSLSQPYTNHFWPEVPGTLI